MALLSPSQLTEVLSTTLEGEGFNVSLESNRRARPLALRVDGRVVRVFLWNIGPGGPNRDPDEYRVQTTRSGGIPLWIPRRRTWLLGYHSELGVFSGWDPRFHPNPGSSSSLQVQFSQLEDAARDGMSSRTRKVDLGIEVVAAFVPAAIRAYLEVASNLPPPGASEDVMRVWAGVGTGEEAKPDDLPRAAARREVIRQTTVKVRDARFRASVLRVYRDRCSFCGLGVGLIEAAHILGVGEGGSDDVTNGMALCPTHHTAFDKGLLAVDEAGAVIVNRGYLRQLGASQAEIAGLKRGLLVKARTPTGSRFRPDPRLLAAHWKRWNVQSG